MDDRTVRRSRLRPAAALGAIAVLLLVTGELFWWPSTDQPTEVDAVIMLGGGGDRLGRALDLIEGDVAPTLVVSSPLRPALPYQPLGRFCEDPHDFELICFDPQPETTRGESQYVARLAHQRGWDEVAVVVSTDQVTRARMLLDRCWDGTIRMVATSHDQPAAWRAIYEWGAMSRAMLTRRSC
ncbi:MAG: YdcF family protein [Actinomycetota bacterium]|nr:YdcF family protein [Actinomycetota bacterium]